MMLVIMTEDRIYDLEVIMTYIHYLLSIINL